MKIIGVAQAGDQLTMTIQSESGSFSISHTVGDDGYTIQGANDLSESQAQELDQAIDRELIERGFLRMGERQVHLEAASQVLEVGFLLNDGTARGTYDTVQELNEDAGPQVTVKRGPESGSPDEVATVPLSEYMMPDGTVVYKER